MSIQVRDLSKTFGTQKAVDQISFEVSPGNIVGFLGPNGAGKSTTMKMLTTFIPPSSGEATVCGYDVQKHALEVRRNTGYLPEKNPLYFDMYVREYLNFAADIHRLGKRKKSRVDEMIQMTGLEKEVKKKIAALSKGYKQRVGLAQALIHDPEVLVLDEPTSGLDPNQIVEIRNLIVAIGKEKTVLLSTHIMQEVQAMCNRVIIINNGRIVADDAIANIQSKSQGTTSISVEFESAVTLGQLQGLKHITNAEHLDGGHWRLHTRQADALRQELMQWSLENKIPIISLQTDRQSLEDAFRKLTKK